MRVRRKCCDFPLVRRGLDWDTVCAASGMDRMLDDIQLKQNLWDHRVALHSERREW